MSTIKSLKAWLGLMKRGDKKTVNAEIKTSIKRLSKTRKSTLNVEKATNC